MKNKLIATTLCLALCAGALTLASCTSNTGANANGGTSVETQGEMLDPEAATRDTETHTSIIDEAESIVDDVTDGTQAENNDNDRAPSGNHHRGLTPFGK